MLANTPHNNPAKVWKQYVGRCGVWRRNRQTDTHTPRVIAAGTLEKNAIPDHVEYLGVRASVRTYVRTSVTLWSKFGRDSAITFHGWVTFGKLFRLQLSKITGYRVQYGSR